MPNLSPDRRVARRSPAEIRAHDRRKLWTLAGLAALFAVLLTAGRLVTG